jgi:hypothetical protein
MAATCKGGGFFLFSSPDLELPCCGAIPKHRTTRQELSAMRESSAAISPLPPVL